jgi:20S proteasome alpha/beta subunit
MTLILAVLTDQYVALASDRRVTDRENKRITRQEDKDTKTFNICGHFLMGFTGLARIDDHRIERWVADVLAGVDANDYFKS